MRVRYLAVGANSTPVEGTIEAESLPLAIDALKRQGLMPFAADEEITERSSWRWLLLTTPGKPKLDGRAAMVRQVGTLLAAGIPLDRALSIASSETQKGPWNAILESVARHVTEGLPLSAALSKCNGGFAEDEIALVRAGEHTGSLVPVLEDLASTLERRLETRSKLLSALIYPAFLLALAPLSLVLIGTVLVPNIAPLFDNTEAEMPLVLRMMVYVATEIRTNGIVWLVVGVACLAVLVGLARRADVRAAIWSRILDMPIARTLARKTEAGRVCRTLSSLLRGGASLQTAMVTAANVAVTDAGRIALRAAADDVIAGKKLPEALRPVPFLEPRAIQMIAIGTETNKLEAMLDFIADGEQRAAERYVERLMTLLTPALTIALGLLVGGIVLSIMRAILSVTDLAVK